MTSPDWQMSSPSWQITNTLSESMLATALVLSLGILVPSHACDMASSERHTWVSKSHHRADLGHRRSRQVGRGKMHDLCSLGITAENNLSVRALAEGLGHQRRPYRITTLASCRLCILLQYYSLPRAHSHV